MTLGGFFGDGDVIFSLRAIFVGGNVKAKHFRDNLLNGNGMFGILYKVFSFFLWEIKIF